MMFPIFMHYGAVTYLGIIFDLIPNATYQYPRSLTFFGYKEDYFKGCFTLKGCGGHLGYVTIIICAYFRHPPLEGSIWNLNYIGLLF